MKKLLLLTPLLILLPQFASATTCGFGSDIGGGQCRGYLTSGTSWTVPNDWSNSGNTIEVIGGGGGGSFLTGGGGGGAYSKASNISLTPASSVAYSVGVGGTGGNTSTPYAGSSGGDTYFCNSVSNCTAISSTAVVVGAKGGAGAAFSQPPAAGVGGVAASGVGTTRYSGGNGADFSAGAGGGGGAAAGPHGSGNPASTNNNNGGAGDAGQGGVGGTVGSSGGTGSEWDVSHGSGGGGGGGNAQYGPGGAGGFYGGGGGFGSAGAPGGTGAQGLIVITYTSVNNCAVTYGNHTMTISTPGTCVVTLPSSFSTLTTQVWGGGGGGGVAFGDFGPCSNPNGGNGGQSSFGLVTAYGGNGGFGSSLCAAQGGGASGGDTNLTGGSSVGYGAYNVYYIGGAASQGGTGGYPDACVVTSYAAYSCNSYPLGGGPAGAPGGGGGGPSWVMADGGGGGAGGYASKSYTPSALTPGSTQTVVVGGGGTGGYISGYYCGFLCPGNYQVWADGGAPGQVTLTWTDSNSPTCSISLSPNPIAYGSSATLTWSSTNANTSFYINNVGYVSASGSTSVSPSSSTDYSGTVVGSGGTATCSAASGTPAGTLNVTPPSNPVATIAASSTSIYTNQPTNLLATFAAGSSDTLTADNIDSPEGTGLGATTNPDSSKTITFTPSSPGTYTFYARAQTGYFTSWTSYASTTVTVTDAPSCTPAYTCSGQTIQYTNSSCQISNVTTCASPGFCSSGSSSCLYPPPAFNQSSNYTGHLQVVPTLVPQGLPTKLYWDVANVSSCSVTGTNGDSWSGTSGSGVTSAPIAQQTTFTLACTGLDSSSINEIQTVNVLPVFQER